MHTSRGDSTEVCELIVPPAFLGDGTAETLFNAALLRLPLKLQDLKKKAPYLCIALSSSLA
jgi:hypothetical protein